jgi:hypothetical protein
MSLKSDIFTRFNLLNICTKHYLLLTLDEKDFIFIIILASPCQFCNPLIALIKLPTILFTVNFSVS